MSQAFDIVGKKDQNQQERSSFIIISTFHRVARETTRILKCRFFIFLGLGTPGALVKTAARLSKSSQTVITPPRRQRGASRIPKQKAGREFREEVRGNDNFKIAFGGVGPQFRRDRPGTGSMGTRAWSYRHGAISVRSRSRLLAVRGKRKFNTGGPSVESSSELLW